VSTDYERFLRERFDFLAPQLDNVDRIAQTGELPDASIAASARVVPSCSPYGGSANN
jgi:soluble cytochrome b562